MKSALINSLPSFLLTLTLASFAYAAEIPEAGFPQSCGIQLKSHNFNVETIDRAHKMGFRVIRRGFY